MTPREIAAAGAPPAPTTQPQATKPTPPSTADAVAIAVAFPRREVGMAHPAAGPFRWTGARTGQVDVRARIAGDVSPQGGPVATVSLQQLSTTWYVLGVRSDAIRVVTPRSQDPIRPPLRLVALAEDPVHVRVTQDRYGKDLALGSADLSPEPAPVLPCQPASSKPSRNRSPTCCPNATTPTRSAAIASASPTGWSSTSSSKFSCSVAVTAASATPPAQLPPFGAAAMSGSRSGWLNNCTCWSFRPTTA